MSKNTSHSISSMVGFYETEEGTTLFYSPEDLQKALAVYRSVRTCLQDAGIHSVILPEYTVTVLAIEGHVDPVSGEWHPNLNEQGEYYTYEQAFQLEYSWYADRERCALIGQYEDEYIELVLSPEEFLSKGEGGDTDV